MLGLAQTRTLIPASQRLFAPWPAFRRSSLVTHHCPSQSLAKHNRKPSQLIENNHQRQRSIASFCRVYCEYSGRPGLSRRPDEQFRNCRALHPQRAKISPLLIASRPGLEMKLNGSRQRRKYFLIARNKVILAAIGAPVALRRHSPFCFLHAAAVRTVRHTRSEPPSEGLAEDDGIVTMDLGWPIVAGSHPDYRDVAPQAGHQTNGCTHALRKNLGCPRSAGRAGAAYLNLY